MSNAIDLDEDLKDPTIDRYDKDQLEKFRNKVANGLGLVKGLEYYSYQLDRYRRSPAVAAIGLVSYMWLFLQTATLLSLINWSLYKANNELFRIEGEASFLGFVHYSVTALFVGEIDAVQPAEGAALVLKIAAALLGMIVIATAALHVFMSLRMTKQDAAFQAMRD